MNRIDLSPKTYERLLHHVQSFDDTPDLVINRILDRIEGEHKSRSVSYVTTVDKKDLLAEKEYWRPILEILVQAGGRAEGRSVIDMLEDRLGDKFTPRDRDVLRMGEVRWRNRARFARLRMKEEGLIDSHSPRGIWEITEAGRRFVNERAPE